MFVHESWNGTMILKLRKFLGASCVTTAAMPGASCEESIRS
jgi:hypothetical protein